jgi:hypothetical protein
LIPKALLPKNYPFFGGLWGLGSVSVALMNPLVLTALSLGVRSLALSEYGGRCVFALQLQTWNFHYCPDFEHYFNNHRLQLHVYRSAASRSSRIITFLLPVYRSPLAGLGPRFTHDLVSFYKKSQNVRSSLTLLLSLECRT